MPNDDDLSKQIAQKRHADALAFERQMMDATGLSRSQVRAELHKSLQNVQTTVDAQRIVRAAEAPRPAPKVEVSETKLESAKGQIPTSPQGGTAQPTGNNLPVMTVIRVLGNLNGVFTERLVYGV
jgi:hypothetical protein